MADTVEKIVLDADGFVGPAQAAVNAFRAMSGAAGEVQQAFQILNKQGELVQLGLKQVNDQGQILTSTLKLTANGWEANNIKIAQTSNQLRQVNTVLGLSAQSIGRLLVVTTIRHAFLDLSNAFLTAAKSAADLQAQIGLTTAFNQNIGSVQQLTQQYASLANEFNRPIADVARAGFEAVQSGVARTSGDLNILNTESARLASITGTTATAAMTTLTGVTQAFGQQVGDASANVNRLFTLSQSGFNLQRVGPQLEAVGVSAHRLGISIEEVFQALTLLRERGNTDTQSIANLQGLLQGLERTTPRAAAALREQGFESIQAAVQTLGLGRTLQTLATIQDETGESTRRLLASRRALGGFTLGEELARGNGRFDNTSEQAANAQRARQIVAETTTFQSEFNKIQVALATQVGPAILEAFGSLGGFSKTIIDIVNAFLQLVPIVAGITKAFAVLADQSVKVAEAVGFINKGTRETAIAERALADARRASEESFNRAQSEQRAGIAEQQRLLEVSVGNAFRQRTQDLGREVTQREDATNRMKDSAVAGAKAVNAGFQGVLNGFVSFARSSENEVEASLKRTADFAEKTERDAFQRRLKTAGEVSQQTPFTNEGQQRNALNLLVAQNAAAQNQVALIQGRRQQLAAEIAQLEQRGDEASIASARKKFEELRRLSEQQRDFQEAAARRTAEFNARATGRNQTFNPFDRERQQDAQQLDALEAGFEARRRARLEAQAEALRRIVELERQRVTESERAVQHVTNFRLPNQTTGEALTPQSRAQVIQEMNQRAAEAIEAMRRVRAQQVEDIANAERTGAITREQAERQRRQLPSEASITAVSGQFAQLNAARVAELDAREAREQSRRQHEQLIQTIKDETTRLITGLELIRTTREQQNAAITNIGTILGNLRNNAAIGTFGNSAQVNNLSDNLQIQLRRAEERLQAVQRNPTQENREALNATLREVERYFVALQAARGRIQVDANGQPIGTGSDATNINSLRIESENLLNATIQRNVEELNSLSNALNQARRAVEAQNARIPEQITPIIRGPVINANPQPGEESPGPAPNDEGYAFGGLIGNSFSGMGPDNRLVNARVGEFIVNPESTRKFYSTLVAINRGDSPGGNGFARGGSVTNSIGNINFHVSGAGNPEQTARVIMNKIRREQRRGNI